MPWLLTAFPPGLNFDYLLHLLNSQTSDEFISKYNPLWHQFGPANVAWLCRDEINRDLTPIVEPISTKQGNNALNELINKINRIGLRCIWVLAPGTQTFVNPADNKELFNWFYLRLGTEHRILKVKREKSIVTMMFYDRGNPRKVYYGMIINALQNGAFDHLSRCKWPECRKFFVAEDLRKKSHCSKACKKSTENEDARLRMQKMRSAADN